MNLDALKKALLMRRGRGIDVKAILEEGGGESQEDLSEKNKKLIEEDLAPESGKEIEGDYSKEDHADTNELKGPPEEGVISNDDMKEDEDPVLEKKNMLAKAKEVLGRLPFANRKSAGSDAGDSDYNDEAMSDLFDERVAGRLEEQGLPGRNIREKAQLRMAKLKKNKRG